MTQNPFRISPSESFYELCEISYIHNGKASRSAAYEINERAKISLRIPRSIAALSARLDLFDESVERKLLSIDFSWSDLLFGSDIYTLAFPVAAVGAGLYFFDIEITTALGTVYLQKNDDGLFLSEKSYQKLQLSVSDFKYQIPEEQCGGIIYHVFVDRFNRGTELTKLNKDSIYIEDWFAEIPEYPEYPGAPLKNNYFYGGTLDGIREKLDYIKKLGVTAIYLSPIFESESNHKYDTANYMSVDTGFGGDKALSRLISSAKKRGIGIILDGVFNHTGANSLYFNRYGKYESVGAYQSRESKYFSWYDFKEFPNDYTSWWGIEILPRINPDVPECRDYFVGDGGVIEKYAKMGILGFRLDVVDELSDEFTSKIKEKLNIHNPHSLLYGEVWEDASNKIAYGKRKHYYLGCELDGVMNYPIRSGLISFLRDKNQCKLRYALTDIIFNAPKRIRDMQMNLIGTHDTERIITALAGEASVGKSNDYLATHYMTDNEYKLGRERLMAAYTVMATLPGIPSVFYGDEVGLEGYSDPFNRRTFPWGKEDKELLLHYRMLGKIRSENEVYKRGEFSLIYLSDELLIFERWDKSYSYITVVNNSNREISIDFSRNATSLFDGKKQNCFRINHGKSVILKARKNTTMEY